MDTHYTILTLVTQTCLVVGEPPEGGRAESTPLINSGVFNCGEFKNDLYFHFRVPPTPARAPWGGPEGVYHQKSSDMSFLGFSIVRISKMMSIFILGYPQPLQGRPWGGLGGEQRGV